MITIGDKQYVTADEILTTEATNFGSNLQDVTDNLGKSIQRLQSEVKWLYKYGIVPRRVYDGFLAEKLMWYKWCCLGSKSNS